MAGINKAQGVCDGIVDPIKGRDKKLLSRFFGQDLIGPGEHPGWMRIVERLDLESTVGARHKNGGRDPFTAHIADEKGKFVLIDREIVIKIPANLVRGRIHSVELNPGRGVKWLWQEVSLNVSGIA
jgi:hypothetical protein